MVNDQNRPTHMFGKPIQYINLPPEDGQILKINKPQWLQVNRPATVQTFDGQMYPVIATAIVNDERDVADVSEWTLTFDVDNMPEAFKKYVDSTTQHMKVFGVPRALIQFEDEQEGTADGT